MVIDPRFTMDAAKADVWLPIRPGTDVALMLSWIKWIIDNERYDEEFCREWTNMPYLVNPETRLTLKAVEAGLEGTEQDYVIWDPDQNMPVVVQYPFNEGVKAPLFGEFEVNGMTCKTGGQVLKEACEEWTIERAADICWLDADQIVKALELYTDPKAHSGLMQGVATDQTPQSGQAALAALELEFLMGNVEKPGGMLQALRPGAHHGAAGHGAAGPFEGEVPQTRGLYRAQRPDVLGHGLHPRHHEDDEL